MQIGIMSILMLQHADDFAFANRQPKEGNTPYREQKFLRNGAIIFRQCRRTSPCAIATESAQIWTRWMLHPLQPWKIPREDLGDTHPEEAVM